jgi:SAM-dependent methyltransferase
MMFDRIKQGALDYHHRTSRIPYGERVVASLSKHLGHVDSLLDIGCGDGVTTRRLADAAGAKRVTGVDVHVRPTAVIEVVAYDGLHIPFPDKAFEAVSIIDVLHHCTEPLTVLKEALRVCSRMVVLKDHFIFGPITNKVLHWMDLAGNAKDGIPCPGTYFTPAEWVSLITSAGGTVAALDWPLKTHDLPWRIVGWPQLQFSARIVPVG